MARVVGEALLKGEQAVPEGERGLGGVTLQGIIDPCDASHSRASVTVVQY